MIPRAWNWLRRNVYLVLTFSASACLSFALGNLVRGATWSMLLPVSIAATGCGWGLGSSRLDRKQAWSSLIGLGVSLIFIFVSGLVFPLGRLFRSFLLLFLQSILWLSEHQAPVDLGPLLTAWSEASTYAAGALARFGTWFMALANGENALDPVAAMLAWNLLLWLVGAWSGWQLRRNRQALTGLAPGGVLLALVSDYTRGETDLVIAYLAILLVLIGLSRNQWRLARWQQRQVDYSDSVAVETLIMVGMLAAGLVFSAAVVPSISWQEMLDKLRRPERAASDQVAGSLGLEAPPNVAQEPAFLSDGLPRKHLLDMPPEQLKDVVMTISTGELPPVPVPGVELQPEHYYWRMVTYDVYTGSGWASSPAQESEVPADTLLLDQPTGYRVLNQHIVRAPGEEEYVYWTGILAQANADMELAWRTTPPSAPVPASNGDVLGARTAPDEYTVVSYLPEIVPSLLYNAGNDYPGEIVHRYLSLPDSVPERVLNLAREITLAEPTPYDRALAIETYLRRFPYTLDVTPPPSGRDVVDYFLFTTQQGYCDYYASAMVILARAAGLPARMVIGYTSGEYDAGTARYIIRKENAHSWAEIYFPRYGWVEFEPTAGQAAINHPQDESASGPPPGLSPGQQAASWLQDRWRDLVTTLGGQLLLAGTAFALIIFLWQAGEIGLLFLIPSSQAIDRMYFLMEKASSGLLPGLSRGHTPWQFKTSLGQVLKGANGRFFSRFLSKAQEEIESLVDLYVAQEFSPHRPERSNIRRGILSWSRLRWRLWVASRWIRGKVRYGD